MARTKITGTGLGLPTADGSALGGASNEYSDLYLADSSIIYFGNDQDVTVTHDPDDGLFFKSIATADNNPINLVLQTGETDMAANDVIGKISFQAPDEGTGTDAILISGAIQARAEGDHSSSSNATSLDFMTGASEAAAKKMSLTSGGDVNVLTDGASLFFGADSEIELRHVADDGLILKHVGTGDGKEPSLTFQAGDNDIAANDVLGSIFFQAPDEGAGTDAILVAAGIEAVSEGDFSSSNNATKLSFKTAANEAAAEKMSLSSAGLLTIADDLMIKDGGTIGVASTNDAITISSACIVTFKDDIVFKDGGTIGVSSATDAMTVSSGGIVTFKDDILIKDAGTIGSASDADAIAIAANGVVTFSQAPVFPDGSINIADIDLDGGTDIGAAIVDADLFLIDDGAGGTMRKTTASRMATYFGGGGKVLQVQHAASTTEASSNNDSTFVDSGLTDDITPANASNQVLVQISQHMMSGDPGGPAVMSLRLMRGTTEVEQWNAVGAKENHGGNWMFQHLDSPSTTSATTYHTEFKRLGDSLAGTVYINDDRYSGTQLPNSTITLIEIDGT